MDKKKLTPEEQFFNDKTLEFAEELYNQNEEKIKDAYRGQINNRDDLLNKIAKILLSYNIADSVLNLNSADKIKLYSELSDSIVANFKSELCFENNLTKGILNSVGKEKYNVNNYVYSLGTDFKITQLSDEALEKIINTKVEDKLWSDRLYDNKNDMSKVLRNEVKKFLNGDTNVNEIENKIKKKYNENAHETKRLVQDNICRVQEGANDEWQHEHDIKYVMYMATLDGKVCANCAQFDGKPFELDKKPVQIPQHPFCRCVYISLVNENWHPKMRLDNETKKNVNWQSYEEWMNNKRQTGGKYTRGDIAWNDRREDESKEYYDSIRKMKDDVSKISKNTGLSEKMIDQIKNHVFYNDKHILYGGRVGSLDADYDMSVAWQRLINNNFEKRDILLLRHEYLESGLEKRYNLTNKQAHDITTRKYDWWGKLVSEKGDLGEDDCLTKIIKEN